MSRIRTNWVECCFEDLLDYEQPTNYIVKSTVYNNAYKTPVLTAGKSFIKGYTNEIEGIFDNLPAIIFDDFTTASKFVNFKFKVKSSAMKILVPTSELINMNFAYYAMQVNQIRSDTHKRYWISTYAKKKFLLPSLLEQRAIVTKIEQLFSDLDKGIADLKTAQDQLKIYRQAVLKKAFEGELTKKWREQQTDLPTADELLEQIKEERQKHYQQQLDNWKQAVKTWEKNDNKGKKPSKPNKYIEVENILSEHIDCLPNINWTVVNFIDFVLLQRGYDLPLKSIVPGNFPVISSGGIAGYHNEFRAKGPALITGRSGGVGNIHFLDVEYYWPHNTVLHVKDFKGNNYKYVHLFFLMFNFKSHSASTAVPTLDRKMLYKLPVKVPSIKEQHQIVQEIESRLSVCDKVEQSITENLEKAKALRQSILKKAFAGNLLSAEELATCKAAPDYEPASVLLARIEQSRNKKIKAKK